MNLSDGEEKFIVNAKIGQGMRGTREGGRSHVDFLGDEEGMLFTTNLKEVTARNFEQVSEILQGRSC